MSSVNLSQDHSSTFITIPQNQTNWKSIMRKKIWTKRPIKKEVPRLPESIKSKNIPKNIAKAVIQQILHGEADNQIQNKKEFLKYINKHKNIQNLSMLLKLTRPHRVERINKLQQQFRQICWNFFRKQYISYVYTSKIKDPSNHLVYRNQMMKIFSEHFQ